MPGTINYKEILLEIGTSKSKYWAAIFILFAFLLSVAVAHHEPWMDEAQAWLLAKETGPVELFAQYLRYEGSPGLWHLILMGPAKLGFPYITLNIIAAVIAAAGVWVFLRHSPFPPAVKFLFPFSYFVFFQYGVVARSYCLVPLLLFVSAANYKEKLSRPFLLVIPLCLLENVSVHSFLVACGIFGVHVWDVVRAWPGLDQRRRLGQIKAGVVFAAVSLLVILVVAPTPADHFLVGGGTNLSPLNFLLVAWWAIPGSLILNEAGSYLILQQILSLAIFAATLWWLRKRKLTLLYLIPLTFLLALFATKYRNFWHDGVTFFLWVFVLWVGYQQDRGTHRISLFEKGFSLAIVIVLAVQVYWSAIAVTNDYFYIYSGSRDTAERIKAEGMDEKRIFSSGWKIAAIQPYFERNIFYNYNSGSERRAWSWSNQNSTPIGFDSIVLEQIELDRPDFVVIASDHLDPDSVREPDGYRIDSVFPGYQYWKTGIQELNAYWIFRRADLPGPESGPKVP